MTFANSLMCFWSAYIVNCLFDNCVEFVQLVQRKCQFKSFRRNDRKVIITPHVVNVLNVLPNYLKSTFKLICSSSWWAWKTNEVWICMISFPFCAILQSFIKHKNLREPSFLLEISIHFRSQNFFRSFFWQSIYLRLIFKVTSINPVLLSRCV